MTKRFKKGVASFFTCGNIICGCLSIISVMDGNFLKASWLLILAIAFDMMDGRIARITNTTSDFGVQLDSLSDLVSFGIAPSIMMYQLVLNDLDKIGVLIAVLFVLCSALRLAKFNVMTQDGVVHSFFMGLPTPASAGLLVSFVLSYELSIYSLTFKTAPILIKSIPLLLNMMPVIMIILSLLMVSNIPYASFKKLKFSHYKIFNFLVLVLLFICIFVQNIINSIFILFFMYILSGVCNYILKSLEGFKKKCFKKIWKNGN
ncbi:MAG: CDP-diacylglycerol--serine O-phosphatidyltransferase [Endomicrobium sp.]|jgi:CDP-diacylglycerol--serine O-phosphatidyltransferase|nr:CDP-diacylglycerol--serine O-phosphatidyltransferase [Endomicrobium sp.]